MLHVGARTPLKWWSAVKWRAVASELRGRGYAVVWSAGHGEEALVRAIDPSSQYPSYAGQLELAQLWRLIANAALLVSVDTSVAHLARLVHTPTVTLFGPGSARIYGPGQFWRDAPYRAVTIDDFPCRDQRLLFRRHVDWVRRCGRSVAECPVPRCMEAIDVDMVKSTIDDVLNSRRAS